MSILLSIILIVLLGLGICLLYKEYCKERNKIAIPFKESMDLLNMPIVTFENNGKKLHFLLDTGSNASLIDQDCLSELDILAKRDIKEVMVTAGEDVPLVGEILMNIVYRDRPFTERFTVTSLAKQFDAAFEGKIKVHGILGSKFFRRNKYIIDFKELAVFYKPN